MKKVRVISAVVLLVTVFVTSQLDLRNAFTYLA